MNLTDLISELCKEAAQKTPNVFDKVIKAAKSEGLLKSAKLNLTESSSAQRATGNAEGNASGAAVPAVKRL